MGRHSGAVCRACQQLIPVRDGRLVEHEQHFPTLGTSLPCVGSHSTPADDAEPQGPPPEGRGAGPTTPLLGGRPRARTSR